MLDITKSIASLPDAIGHCRHSQTFCILSDTVSTSASDTDEFDGDSILERTDNRLVALRMIRKHGGVGRTGPIESADELPASIGMLVNLRELHLDQTSDNAAGTMGTGEMLECSR